MYIQSLKICFNGLKDYIKILTELKTSTPSPRNNKIDKKIQLANEAREHIEIAMQKLKEYNAL